MNVETLPREVFPLVTDPTLVSNDQSYKGYKNLQKIIDSVCDCRKQDCRRNFVHDIFWFFKGTDEYLLSETYRKFTISST